MPLIGPFGDEAVATIIGVVLGSFLTYLMVRVRPRRIRCSELATLFPLYKGIPVEISKVKYDERPVKNLAVARLLLQNQGQRVIEEPGISIEVDGAVALLDVTSNMSDQRYTYTHTTAPSGLKIVLTLDYLNPTKQYGEDFLINLVFDGQAKALDVKGSGPDWSIEFVSRETQRRRRLRWDLLFLVVLTAPPIAALLLSGSASSITWFQNLSFIEIVGYSVAWGIMCVMAGGALGYRRSEAILLGASVIRGARGAIQSILLYGRE